MRARRGGTGIRGRGSSLWTLALLSLAACGPRQHVALRPGVQPGDATVDVETGTVTRGQDGIAVDVQAAMLPEPHGDRPRPTFWVTVRNDRDEKIVVTPADARLVDSFGVQHAPVPMSVEGSGGNLRYALVDPEVHSYVALHFGWPYYPIYPYRSWFPHWRDSRIRPWHYDPFWSMGVRPVWIVEIAPPSRARAPMSADLPLREETIHRGARLTWVVVFPELERTVRDVRLIIPEIQVRKDGELLKTLEFEMVFDQIVEVDGRGEGP